MILLALIFTHTYPKEKNYFYGFRTKKSMQNEENWIKAQLYFVDYTKKIFKYSAILGLLFLILDIFIIIFKNEDVLIVSILTQTGLLFILLFLLYWIVNRKL